MLNVVLLGVGAGVVFVFVIVFLFGVLERDQRAADKQTEQELAARYAEASATAVNVVVAKTQIPARTLLKPDDFEFKAVRYSQVPYLVTSFDQLNGMAAYANLTPGQTIGFDDIYSPADATQTPSIADASFDASHYSVPYVPIGDLLSATVTIVNTSDRPLRTSGPTPDGVLDSTRSDVPLDRGPDHHGMLANDGGTLNGTWHLAVL